MKLFIAFAFLFLATSAFAQDSLLMRKTVDTLTSTYFWGRGYTNNGMAKAADFIAATFKQYNVQPLKGKDYFQNFSYNVNTFPGNMDVNINGVTLTPGVDFIVSPDSKGVKGSGSLRQADSVTYIDDRNKIIVKLEKKLTWSVASEVADYTLIQVDKANLAAEPKKITAIIDNKLIHDFKAANVYGLVKGTKYPDSIIFITAHYDHLGGMGTDTYFPGANDNASGVTLLLSLAKYYAANPQPYSIGFICFAGEEAGLIGSKYYVAHPVKPLKNISFLLNLDLEGTGSDGITVVNATEFPRQFSYMQSINTNKKYLAAVNVRGKAANSDHYYFSEHGVPAFFMYTIGGIAAYHDVFDKAETLPLTEMQDLYRFIIDFNNKLMNK